MTSTSSDAGSGANPDVGQIEAEIARTRAELAETVDELTARLDLKARARQRVGEIKERAVARSQSVRAGATDDQGRPTPAALGAGGAAAAALVAVVVLLVRRRRRR